MGWLPCLLDAVRQGSLLYISLPIGQLSYKPYPALISLDNTIQLENLGLTGFISKRTFQL